MEKMDGSDPISLYQTRESLLLRLKDSRDESAWLEFYQIYGRLIFGYALQFNISYAEAEDIVQEVCVKVFRQIIRFDYSPMQGRFLGWLKTITRNAVIDYLRRKQNRTKTSRAFSRHVEATLKSIDAKDEELWRQEWQKALYEVALERVRERVGEETYRVFYEYVLENRSAEDVASEVAMDANAVYAVKHRVLRYLREEVQHILDSE